MPRTDGTRLWIADDGPAPEGWTPVRSAWHAILYILEYPDDVIELAITEHRDHKAVAWMVTGGKALGELPRDAVPEITVRR